MSRAIEEDPTADAPATPIPLDGLAYGVDRLDAILVFHLGDAHLHASWVRADAGFKAEEAVGSLRDAYRVSQFASRRLAVFGGVHERRGEAQNPLLTLEIPSRVALLRRIRSYVVAVVFDGTMPLGMARLLAARLAVSLEPELPLGEGASADPPRVQVPSIPRPRSQSSPPGEDEREPATVAFVRSRSRPPMPRVTLTELDRTRRLLTFLEATAPEPHVARLRLALRTGLTPLALDHPEALGAEAAVLIETAVEDILGVDRSEIRSVV